MVCPRCGKAKDKFEDAYLLTLPVKTSDKIEQALAKALEPEVIAEYTCSFCGEKVDV